jgi:hypothetical protein
VAERGISSTSARAIVVVNASREPRRTSPPSSSAGIEMPPTSSPRSDCDT